MDEKLTSALNLMRRMPPSSIKNSLAGLIELVPDLTDELLNHVDQPLEIQKDPKTGKQYILCDYNRDGDSYRSPWSNEYFPEIADGFLPSKKLREMEVAANYIFDVYRQLYFEGGHSSVYFFNTEEKSDKDFGACFLVHKDVDGVQGLDKGMWDSIHVFEVRAGQGSNYDYKLTTTVLVSMVLKSNDVGEVDLSGSMTKQDTKSLPVDAEHPHILNLGKMLEDMELSVRNSIEGIYIQKTREVLNGTRQLGGPSAKMFDSIVRSLADKQSK